MTALIELELIQKYLCNLRRNIVMGRLKKDGQFFTCYLRKDILDNLTLYSDDTSIPKTAIVEKALEKYLADVMKSKTDSQEKK